MLLRLTFLCLAASILAAQDDARNERWRQDLSQLATELPRSHVNFFHQLAPEDFERAVAQLNESIPSKADYEIAIDMARIVALAGDAHTSVAGLPIRLYPIRVYWFSDGLFVTQASFTHSRLLGKRLVRINDTPVEEVYTKVKALIPHENEHWARTLSPTYLVSPEVLHAVRVIPELGAARYEIENGESANILPSGEALIPGPHKARPAPPLYRRNPALYYWFDYIEPSRTLYVKYNVCADSPSLPFAQFTEQFLAFVRANAVDRIVFDLRDNSGGDSSVLLPLLNGLAQLFASGVVSSQAKGFGIIGRQTFSSGMLNAINLTSGGVRLVGEPTGGKPSGYGEVRSFVLQNSRLQVRYSTRLFQIQGQDGPSLMPDIPVTVAATDYFGEQDPVMEAILRQD